MRNLFLSAAATALALGVSLGVSQAAPLLTPDGDPFPAGSVAYLTGGPYMTPWGTFDMTTVSNFDGFSLQTIGGNEIFTYLGVSQTVTFDNQGVYSTFTLTDGVVKVEIFKRTNLFEAGKFNAQMLEATWTGTIDGDAVVARINPIVPTTGTVTYSYISNTRSGLVVDYKFNNQTEFSVDGGPFLPTPLTGVPAPAPIPEAPAWAMMLMGFAGLGLVSYRRLAGPIPIGSIGVARRL